MKLKIPTFGRKENSCANPPSSPSIPDILLPESPLDELRTNAPESDPKPTRTQGRLLRARAHATRIVSYGTPLAKQAQSIGMGAAREVLSANTAGKIAGHLVLGALRGASEHSEGKILRASTEIVHQLVHGPSETPITARSAEVEVVEASPPAVARTAWLKAKAGYALTFISGAVVALSIEAAFR